MNTRTLWIGAAALVLAAGCNRDRQTSGGSVLDRAGDRQASITVSGCLQPGEQGLGSREPSAASRSENVDRFVLTPISASSNDSAASPSGSPQSSASANTANSPVYILEGKKDELRSHIGQRIEVTGKPDDNASSDAPNAQRLEVESVRMLAQNCSGA